jgi:cytosine permease
LLLRYLALFVTLFLRLIEHEDLSMQNVSDYANGPVPEQEGPRFKWLYLTNVENAVTVCVPVFLLGASLGSSLPLSSLLAVLGLSGALLALLSGWTSYIGTKTRLSTSLLAKRSFGEQGVKIVWLILAISLFGWFGVQTEIFAKVFLVLAGKLLPQISFNPTLVTIAAGLLMSTTAVLGIKGVGKLAQLSVPLLLGVMAYALYMALSTHSLSALSPTNPEGSLGFGPTVAAVIGAYAVGVVVMPDIKRFAKNTKHSVASGVLALGIAYPALLLCTALTTALYQQPDYMEILVGLGLGSFSLVILLLATWTTNDLNLYSASLSLAPMMPRFSRPVLTAFSGLVGTALATLGLFEKMMPLFMFFGVLTMPLLALYSADLFAPPQQGVRKWIPASFAIWIASSFFGIASTSPEQWGLALFPALTSVSGLDALVIAALLCALRTLWRKHCHGLSQAPA